MRILFLATTLFAVALGLARTPAVGEEEPAVRAPLPSSALVIREVRVVRNARAVVLARVHQVHASPGVWCGIAETRQDVTWQVERVIDGEAPGERVRVGHLLVAESRLVDREEPRLDPALVAAGRYAVLCLVQDDEGHWLVQDEDYGVRLTLAPEPSDVR